MTSNTLQLLPESLQCEIFTKWLDWKSLGRFDSAVCSVRFRPQYFKVVAQKIGASPRDTGARVALLFLRWTVLRAVRLTAVILPVVYPEDAATWSTCIAFHAPILREVTFIHINSEISENLVTALIGAPHLVRIKVLQCEETKGIARIIERLGRSLELLHFFKSNLKSLQITPMSQFASLTDLYAEDCTNLSSSVLQHMCKSTKLRKIMAGEELTERAVTELTTHCEQIEMISFSVCPMVTDNALAPLLARCTNLMFCDIACNDQAGDESVIAVVTHCKKLQSLAIGGRRNVTDASLEAIATHCGPRLRDLLLGHGTSCTDSGLETLARTCTALDSLGISCFRSKFSAVGIVKLVSVNPLLRYLDVAHAPGARSILQKVGEHCPRLVYLNICSVMGIDKHSLTLVLSKCTELRILAATIGETERLMVAEFERIQFTRQDLPLPCWAQCSYNFTDSVGRTDALKYEFVRT